MVGRCGGNSGNVQQGQEWGQQREQQMPLPPTAMPPAQDQNDIADTPPQNGQGQNGNTGIDQRDQELLDEINKVRREHGLQPLTMDSRLMEGASANNNANASSGNLGHHYSLGTWGADGEITAGAGGSNMSAKEAVQLWLNSPGHRNILLDPNQTEIGVDLSQGYATADFI